MKKVVLILIFFLSFIGLFAVVKAQELRSAETVILRQNQTVDGNFFAGGELVRIEGVAQKSSSK